MHEIMLFYSFIIFLFPIPNLRPELDLHHRHIQKKEQFNEWNNDHMDFLALGRTF